MRIILLLICLTLVFGTVYTGLAGEEGYENRVIVRVDDEPITEFDLTLYLRYADPSYFNLRKIIANPELLTVKQETRELKALQSFAQIRAMLAYAKRKKLSVPETQRKKMFEKFLEKKAERYGSAQKYREHLASRRLTDKQVFKFVLEKELMTELRLKEFRPMRVSPEEIRNVYGANRELFKAPPRYHIRHFEVKKTAENRTLEEARKLAEKALDLLKAGSPFEDVARNSSEGISAEEGGALEWYEGNASLLSPVPETVKSLEAGNLSEIIETADAFHFVRLEKKEPKRQLSLNEASDRIESHLKARNWGWAKAVALGKALEVVTFEPERFQLAPGRNLTWKEFLKGNITLQKPER
ncbi:MAG: hypothetical protein E3J72_14240 [Planctomycetota bacterium]|nr:MAG: hypothetical protein E3J72_14240 [Planctomycetota bacterium]